MYKHLICLQNVSKMNLIIPYIGLSESDSCANLDIIPK